MRTLLTLSLALGLFLAVAPTATASSSEDYTGFGEFLGECRGGEVPWAACFQAPSGSSHVDVDASDEVGLNVYLWIVYRDAQHDIIDSEFACNGVDRPLPAGTEEVDVIVQDPALAAFPGFCLGATATTGTITASFS